MPTYMLICMHVHMNATHMHIEVEEKGEVGPVFLYFLILIYTFIYYTGIAQK